MHLPFTRRDSIKHLSVVALGMAGMENALAQSATAKWLFVGTYSRGNSKGIYRLSFNPKNGDWSAPELAAETTSPSFLAIHPKQTALFAVNEVAEFHGEKSGSVSAFALNRGTGQLTARNVVASKGGGPCHLALSASGNVLLVANYGAGSVSSYRVLPDGSVSEAVSTVQHEGSGPNSRRQSGPHAHGIALRRVGGSSIAWVADLGIDQLRAYQVDESTGTLRSWDVQPSVPLAPGAGPRHVVVHPKRPLGFVINEMLSTISVFAIHPRSGIWKELQTLSTLPEGYTGENTTAEIALHPNGQFVYGSNRGHDSIATFRLDRDGKLRLAAHTASGGKMPRNFVLHPGGRFLVSANQGSGNLVLFTVKPETGVPAVTEKTASIDFPVCAVFAG